MASTFISLINHVITSWCFFPHDCRSTQEVLGSCRATRTVSACVHCLLALKNKTHILPQANKTISRVITPFLQGHTDTYLTMCVPYLICTLKTWKPNLGQDFCYCISWKQSFILQTCNHRLFIHSFSKTQTSYHLKQAVTCKSDC